MPAADPECDDCLGEGKIREETTRECKNCKGNGHCAAGHGNTFVCAVCDGEGEEKLIRETECATCKGTGRLSQTGTAAAGKAKAKAKAKVASAKAAPRVVGRTGGGAANRPSGSSRDGDAAADDDADEGRGINEESNDDGRGAGGGHGRGRGGGGGRPGGVRGQRSNRDEEAGDADHDHHRKARGVRWEAGVGLIIDVTITTAAFLNCGGFVFLLVGLVMIAQDLIIWPILGCAFVLAAVMMIFKANTKRCTEGWHKFFELLGAKPEGEGAAAGGGAGGNV